MYDTIYAMYNFKRKGRVGWDGHDTTRVKVEFTGDLMFGQYDGRSAECIEKQGDTSRYDCQDAVYPMDETVYQQFDIDPRDLLANDSIYLQLPPERYVPIREFEMPRKLYYYLADVPDDWETFPRVAKFNIQKDHETWNIELELAGHYSNYTWEFPHTKHAPITALVYNPINTSERQVIQLVDETDDTYKARIGHIKKCIEDAKNALNEHEQEQKRLADEAAKRQELLNRISRLNVQELEVLAASKQI